MAKTATPTGRRPARPVTFTLTAAQRRPVRRDRASRSPTPVPREVTGVRRHDRDPRRHLRARPATPSAAPRRTLANGASFVVTVTGTVAAGHARRHPGQHRVGRRRDARATRRTPTTPRPRRRGCRPAPTSPSPRPAPPRVAAGNTITWTITACERRSVGRHAASVVQDALPERRHLRQRQRHRRHLHAAAGRHRRSARRLHRRRPSPRRDPRDHARRPRRRRRGRRARTLTNTATVSVGDHRPDARQQQRRRTTTTVTTSADVSAGQDGHPDDPHRRRRRHLLRRRPNNGPSTAQDVAVDRHPARRA